MHGLSRGKGAGAGFKDAAQHRGKPLQRVKEAVLMYRVNEAVLVTVQCSRTEATCLLTHSTRVML